MDDAKRPSLSYILDAVDVATLASDRMPSIAAIVCIVRSSQSCFACSMFISGARQIST